MAELIGIYPNEYDIETGQFNNIRIEIRTLSPAMVENLRKGIIAWCKHPDTTNLSKLNEAVRAAEYEAGKYSFFKSAILNHLKGRNLTRSDMTELMLETPLDAPILEAAFLALRKEGKIVTMSNAEHENSIWRLKG